MLEDAFAVAGPRKLDARQEEVVVTAVMALGAKELTSGAQYGTDTVAALTADAVGVPLVRLTVPEGCRHNETLVAKFEAHGHEIVRVPWRGSASDTYLARNAVTVSFAKALLATPKTSREVIRSGTWACVRTARKVGIEVRFVPLDGSDPWTEPATKTALF